MKKINEFVQKIKSHYVGNDCVQVMIPYQNALTIVSPDGMLYHHTPESRIYINKSIFTTIIFLYSNFNIIT